LGKKRKRRRWYGEEIRSKIRKEQEDEDSLLKKILIQVRVTLVPLAIQVIVAKVPRPIFTILRTQKAVSIKTLWTLLTIIFTPVKQRLFLRVLGY